MFQALTIVCAYSVSLSGRFQEGGMQAMAFFVHTNTTKLPSQMPMMRTAGRG